MRHLALGGLVLLTLVTAIDASPAAAQYGPQPPNQLYYQSTSIARLNPLGLIENLRGVYRRRLFTTPNIFLRDNYVGVGGNVQLSPAFARVGAYAEVQPVPYVQVWGLYEVVGFIGTFDYLTSYDDPSAEFSDSDIDDQGEAGENYIAVGGQLTLGLTLQMKLGPAAIRNQMRVTRPDMDLHGDDRYFYDPVYDAMIEDGGWLLHDDLDLLYLPRERWVVGARYSITAPFYSDADVGDNGPHDRVGFLLAHTFFEEYKAAFNGPTVLLLVQWYLRHRYRTGDDVSQGIPYVVLGFDFRGDLLPTAGR